MQINFLAEPYARARTSIWRALTRHTTEAESMRIRLSVRSATRRHNDITQRQQTRRVLPTSSRQVEAHLPLRKRSAREDNGAREFDATCRQDKRLAEVLVRVRAVASTGHAYLQRFAVAQLQVDRR